MAAPPTTSPLAVLGRLTWMMFGPLALLLAAWGVVSKGGGWLTTADLAYLAVLAAMLLGRWLEFRGGSPQKATGEPATPADLRRYVIFTLVIGLGVWVVANLLGNYWLAR
ncbi:MAG TPA: hypothetical protein VNK04_11985 [Gemmataceae bacterium]|nr:hypothetical protein [Gemmataceae bacterium]